MLKNTNNTFGYVKFLHYLKASDKGSILPSSSTFPLFGISFTNPLSRHRTDVVLCVKVCLFYFSSIYHINYIIYGNAVWKIDTWNIIWNIKNTSKAHSLIIGLRQGFQFTGSNGFGQYRIFTKVTGMDPAPSCRQQQ